MPTLRALIQLRGSYGSIRTGQEFETDEDTARFLESHGRAERSWSPEQKVDPMFLPCATLKVLSGLSRLDEPNVAGGMPVQDGDSDAPEGVRGGLPKRRRDAARQAVPKEQTGLQRED